RHPAAPGMAATSPTDRPSIPATAQPASTTGNRRCLLPHADALTGAIGSLSPCVLAQVLARLLADERRRLPGYLRVPQYRRECMPERGFLLVSQFPWELHQLPRTLVPVESLITDPGTHSLLKRAKLLLPIRIIVPDHDHLAVNRPSVIALHAA